MHPRATQERKKRNDAIELQLHPNFTHFLTHVVHLAKVEINQRRFAPILAHITGITGPLHRNTQRYRKVLAGQVRGRSEFRLSKTACCNEG